MDSSLMPSLKALFLGFISITGIALYPAQVLPDQAELGKQIRILEEDFKRISSKFYKDKSSKPAISKNRITDIDKLLAEVQHLKQNKQDIAAIQLLFYNESTIFDNIDHKAIFIFTELLLTNNEWKLAEKILKEIQYLGDKSLLGTIQFTFAKYHAKRNQWKKVTLLLNNMFDDLTAEDAAYAYLLNGTALQRQKKHRPAVSNYSKIPPTSKYYAYAQLNTAIANIRQGWWTDAQSTIRNLLKLSNKDNSDEVVNRLYLVLGYSLLQREFYRDARDAFRNIGLKSRYTNRALLGIGLTATSQGDFIGGLNALSILKQKKTFDLSVDESYLLIPYVYEKLQQELTVTASYTEAMNYYQRRMSSLKSITNKHVDFNSTTYDSDTASLIIKNNSLEYGSKFPESFINNYKMLLKFSFKSKNKKLNKIINKLISKHDKLLQQIIGDLTQRRISYLKSYLNQSRYGLARLYDNRNEGAN